ncbi:MAG: putative 2,3-dihydroxybiphenyl 1,2-dioxygenase or glyoxalase/bleomycin resistance protein [Frankiales bacterium]|nr:putative 2,3-dihydroxybiphenyl 1,2-dioxygenase or glyoxalase/bleomycin resistance protein [Frankiales bacterium]
MGAFVHSLGYLVVETTDLDRWRELAVDVLGMAVGQGPDPEALYLRIDDRPARVVVHPGQTDRLVTVGWEVRDRETWRQVVRRLEDAGAPVKVGSSAEADERRVQELVFTQDPSGTQLEVFHGPALVHDKLLTPHGATFVTGGQGLGHVVLPTTNAEEAYDFYSQVLGFRSRGAFKLPPGMPGTPPDARRYLRFLSCNERHHALALAPWPQENGIIHFMLEVTELDDVGRALDRLHKRKFPLSSTLGRHTNDKMVSFYVATPSGFDVELGCFGLRVKEDDYTAEDITADSTWGHRWGGGAR